MTLPNRCCVNCRDRRQSSSSNSPAAGEIRWAKSVRETGDSSRLCRATPLVVESERFNQEVSGSLLNSATKLTFETYQSRVQCREVGRASNVLAASRPSSAVVLLARRRQNQTSDAGSTVGGGDRQKALSNGWRPHWGRARTFALFNLFEAMCQVRQQLFFAGNHATELVNPRLEFRIINVLQKGFRTDD